MAFPPAQGSGGGGGSLGVDIATGEIQDAAVTLAKMADLAQDKFIVRTTASTGVPEVATVTAAARTVLDDATVSAMLDTLGGASATGTGGVVRATSPTLVTPVLGTPTSGSLAACTGGKQVVEAHTGDDTLTVAESGSLHTNSGAGGTVVLTLPAATGSGVWFDFAVLATQTLTLEPNDADDQIYLNAAVSTANTGTVSVGTIGRTLRIVDFAANKWIGTAQVGAWTVS